jgi:hypothetical protein
MQLAAPRARRARALPLQREPRGGDRRRGAGRAGVAPPSPGGGGRRFLGRFFCVCVCVCVCACVRARALARHGEEGSEAAGGAQAHARACVETLMQNGALSLPTEPAAPYTPTQACPELRRSRRRC